MNISEKIGHTLKTVRLNNKSTLEKTGIAIGTSKGMMSYYENGIKNIPYKRLEHFCNHFDLSLSQFFKKVEKCYEDMETAISSKKEMKGNCYQCGKKLKKYRIERSYATR